MFRFAQWKRVRFELEQVEILNWVDFRGRGLKTVEVLVKSHWSEIFKQFINTIRRINQCFKSMPGNYKNS